MKARSQAPKQAEGPLGGREVSRSFRSSPALKIEKFEKRAPAYSLRRTTRCKQWPQRREGTRFTQTPILISCTPQLVSVIELMNLYDGAR